MPKGVAVGMYASSLAYLLRPRHYAKTTFCTGFWEVPNNRKRSTEHYRRYAVGSLKLLRGARVVVHSDTDWFIETARRVLGRDLVAVHRSTPDELPMAGAAKRLLKEWKNQDDSILTSLYDDQSRAWIEKGLIHKQRELNGSGEEAALAILTIWLSKIQLTTDAATSCGSRVAAGGQPPWLGWIDASLSRFNHQRAKWDIRTVSPLAGRILHYSNDMLYMAAPLPINASFLFGDAPTMALLAADFAKTLEETVESRYCHDEETLLGLIHARQSQLFCCIDRPT